MMVGIGQIAGAALVCLGAAIPALADDADWAGMYKGLDARDGSVDHLSIVPVGDGKFDIRIVPSTNSMCDDGRGWIVAEGRLSDGALLRENVTVHCRGAEPKTVSDGVYYRDQETGMLTIESADDGRKLYYHLLSPRDDA